MIKGAVAAVVAPALPAGPQVIAGMDAHQLAAEGQMLLDIYGNAFFVYTKDGWKVMGELPEGYSPTDDVVHLRREEMTSTYGHHAHSQESHLRDQLD